MTSGMTTFLIAVGAVTLAEMGDKTQLLAMCFAARYKSLQVLIGVFAATVLNHALAVTAGYLLKQVLAPYTVYIRMVAALSFIGFALWTIKGDSVDDESETKSRFGPVITVAIAFFAAEMGDKTQLATISLAANYGHPVVLLAGTTTGMLIADGLGIIFGVVMNRKIPEKTLKWISASIFAACGIAGYVETASGIMPFGTLVLTIVLIAALTVSLALLIVRHNGKKSSTIVTD